MGGGVANTLILSSPSMVELPRVLPSLSDENECVLAVASVSSFFAVSEGNAVYALKFFNSGTLICCYFLSYMTGSEVV